MPVEPDNIILRKPNPPGGTLTQSIEPTVLVTLQAQVIGTPPGRFKYEHATWYTDVEGVDLVVDANDGNKAELRLKWLDSIDPQFTLVKSTATPNAPAPTRINESAEQRTRFTFGVPAISGKTYEYDLVPNAPAYRLKVVVRRQ
jgi:hypothetical protein